MYSAHGLKRKYGEEESLSERERRFQEGLTSTQESSLLHLSAQQKLQSLCY